MQLNRVTEILYRVHERLRRDLEATPGCDLAEDIELIRELKDAFVAIEKDFNRLEGRLNGMRRHANE